MNSHQQEIAFKLLRDHLTDALHLIASSGYDRCNPRFMEALGIIEGVREMCDRAIPRPLNEIVDLPDFVEDPDADKPAERWL
jgi:hypothetical protein